MTFYESFRGLEIDLELAVRVGAHNAGFHPTDQRKFTALEFTIHFMRFRMACLMWFFVFPQRCWGSLESCSSAFGQLFKTSFSCHFD